MGWGWSLRLLCRAHILVPFLFLNARPSGIGGEKWTPHGMEPENVYLDSLSCRLIINITCLFSIFNIHERHLSFLFLLINGYTLMNGRCKRPGDVTVFLEARFFFFFFVRATDRILSPHPLSFSFILLLWCGCGAKLSGAMRRIF